MRLTVLGGCGAWPAAGEACSGFLVEHDGFRLVLDLGYATLPRLLQHVAAEDVDAVFVSHGHPDHCVDLNPLLRARSLGGKRPEPLPVYGLPGSLDAVLALDRAGMLDGAFELRDIVPHMSIGPFDAATRMLPHFVPNAGIRLTAGGRTLAYTGDTGPSPHIAELARDADVLVAEATYVDSVPEASRPYLSSARQAGISAADAGVGRLVLSHLWPGTDPELAIAGARRHFTGEISVAAANVTVEAG